MQQRQEPRHRDLTLMVLREHEAAKVRPEMPADALRQRSGHHVAVGHLPTLAAEVHNVRTDQQVLHNELCIAFEARARGRSFDFDDSLFMDRKLRGLATLAALRARTCGRRLSRFVHAAGFDVWPWRASLEPRNLVALRRHRAPQFRHLVQEL